MKYGNCSDIDVVSHAREAGVSKMQPIKFSYFWAMPSPDTFDIKPIGELVSRYIKNSTVSIDPFARNKRWATYTNDLNPDTAAEYHLDAFDFLMMLQDRDVKADLVIFDPPYSMQQSKQCYEDFGSGKFTAENAQNVGHWAKEKQVCNELLLPGGVFIHCGWHSNGLGKKYNMQKTEIMLVAHGRAHNDTIVTVEKKLGHQERMFSNNG